jgi:Fe-S-cluster containining protein
MISQFVPQEICLSCRGCCRFSEKDSIWQPHLLAEEKEGLEKKVKLLPSPAGSGFICACLEEDSSKCNIYGLRPFECQLYPLVLNRKDNRIFLAVDLNCPFAQGKLHSPQFKEYLKYLSGLFASPQYLKVLKSNPQAIQAYDEVFDLAELKLI